MNVTLLAIAGVVIIIALASYAGYLLLQLKKQKELQLKHQKLAIDKRNANIFENVHTLCQAGIQGQCDLSEISIRVYNIMDYVQGEDRVDFDKTYPAISELYHIVKDMARGEERQQLAKKERMQQNLTRHKAESRLTDAIIEELKVLQKNVQPLNNQINIQMI
ncbi:MULTISPECIES: DUF2489 domain-containing protein [Vibrio]|jgi:hypothetical protein|uniref:DUF2489 domain-containing protein n=6 Tax=Gammaproteobacteria TaxID=1236 RepID=A0A0T7DW51_9VIBR|nr:MULTISPECIES: DUF2489 domain-containing protein [Vibrio]EEZ84931.1 hypothetical protein VMC_02530 [Vibrio alginolyticus 40B]KOY44857.1 coproporphyrinogen III oxidase [Vibrio parahaemolyticus]MDW1807980.1 DUF2489 domain-containing protein [Vibrio sp. Vb2362]MDW1972413.1 DUF2489 domain-containing protein [Vibrio sp. 945]MDW2259032.1 DUF2489 domain-containing protein [Vibrio sp. 1409]MDW2296231.1 DUF2489 domain-containing protein [Vibrio sp. 1404]MEA3483893.1 DUF2489 domain-containing protei